MSSLEKRKQEFNEHVWDHSSDDFHTQFDERRPLSDDEREALTRICKPIGERADDGEVAAALDREIREDDGLLGVVLQLCGLTRNKILTDLRASAGLGETSVRIPGNYGALPRSSAWGLALEYLVPKLRRVLLPVADGNTVLADALESVNQATWPGFIRQERAKRSGHEAEYRIATVLAACDIPFEPEEKADNPLCRDAQINGVSFDIVVPSAEKPGLCVKATVHTSNIGQFGESKDHLEVDEARRMIDESKWSGKPPLLVALVDGVGFQSNRAGLEGVLEKADEFCQYRTLWKIVVMAAQRAGHQVRLMLPKEEARRFGPFLERYKEAARLEPFDEKLTRSDDVVQAGDGFVILE